MSSGRFGAYGFILNNLDDEGHWLNPAPQDWPTVEVSQLTASPVPDTGGEVVEVALIGGRSLRLRNEPPEMCFVGGSELSRDALIHPYLAPAASVLAHWRGWITLHAGAFETDGRAWILIADRNGGKSTTLAAMSEMDHPVLADDLIVIKDGFAMAGPRSLDLREQGQFRSAEDLGIVGERRRWRLRLLPVPPEIPVAGVIKLTWTDKPVVRTIAVEDRSEMLLSALSMPVAPIGMLDLLGLRMFEVGRPQGPLKNTTDLVERVVEDK